MTLKYIIPILIVTTFLTACSDDELNDIAPTINEVEDLLKIQELTNASHTIELFNKTGRLNTGYNAISLRIKDQATNNYLENAEVSWLPVMQMPSMQHSCPNTNPIKAVGKNTVFKGHIIFQMASSDGSGWSLTLNYTINDVDYSVTSDILVHQNEQQQVTSFIGSDNKLYVVTIIEPKMPIIGNNELVLGVYEMENMMSFPVVDNVSLTLDPRMPGMGNHSSPNNTDLSYNSATTLYHSNLSLTMTGYWVLNLKLLNSEGVVLKGENVTETNFQSSLYLELEF